MSVVTRFAPSLTGFLHIGGARTALFNYLFAAHHSGRYLLRIEDTDKKRSTSEAIEAIHDGLNWLGLGGNEEVILQSERVERHRAVAKEMLAAGTAYKCFLSDEELSRYPESAAANQASLWRSPWRDRSDYHQCRLHMWCDLKMPDEGVTNIQDMVQGDVSVQNSS